ncbi:MAG: ATP-binding protein [Desulfuromonadaceae bacterium]
MNTLHQLLLLEEDPADARLVREYLAQRPFAITQATSLLAAREHLAKQAFDLILVDLNLPDSTGLDTLHTLLQESGRLPVVILTGMEIDSLAREAMQAGAQDYLTKTDLTPELLERTLIYAIERQQTTQLLHNSLREVEEIRDQLQDILAALSDGLLVTDKLGGIELANPAAIRLLAPDTGILTEALLPPMLKKEIHACLEEKQPCRHEFSMTVPTVNQTEARVLKVVLSPFNSKGIIALLQDISKEQRCETLKQQFISVTAHELRTPLTAILGFSELLLDMPDLATAERISYQRIIQSNAEVLAGLTDQLLDISLVEIGSKLPLQPSSFDLHKALLQMANDLQKTHPEHRIETELLPARLRIHADRDRILRVVKQLLINALKFSPQPTPVFVRGQFDDAGYILTIHDQGLGMTKEQQQDLFQPFYRVDGTDTAKGGLGIGLALAKSVLKAHEGSISIESAPERGTTVSLRLPSKIFLPE